MKTLTESVDQWGMPLGEAVPKSQADFLRKRTKEFLASHPKYKALEEKLLSLGGEFVALELDSDLDALLKKGRVIDLPIQKVRGAVSRCHSNTAKLWDKNKDSGFQIWTGWVLDDDTIWRQHSWGVMGGKIIETTEKREVYFGVELSDEQAREFFYDNAY